MDLETTHTTDGKLPGIPTAAFIKGSRTGLIVLLCLALATVTLAVYLQAGDHQFLNFDDDVYVTNNPHITSGLTGRNISWALTSVEAANWHPLTWLSHMADVQLYGMDPRGHHLTSVAIHTVSTLLLFLLLFRLSGGVWQSAFVAAMFALHPLHVESVAWVAERKDVLSALFWFLTLLFYAEYAAKRKPVLYIFTLLSFVLGLMAKSMLVTVPLIILLLDFWPLGRFRSVEKEPCLRQISFGVIALGIEKIPFFACSLASGLITVYAQHKGGAVKDLNVLPFLLRGENALIAYVRYIGKALFPRDLAVYYPFSLSIPFWQVIGSLSILLLVSVTAIRSGRRRPYFAVGWLWFLISLVPVIGLIQVGAQSMADRYSYVPLTGLFIMAAWGVADLAAGLRHRHGVLALLAGGAVIASAVMSWQQLGYWRDSSSLYRRALQVTVGNYLIHNDLGADLADKGQIDEAIQEYREALRIFPGYSDAHYNLGVALQAKGYLYAAIQEYLEAVRINPNNADAHINLAWALAGKGELDGAIREYGEALRINPDDPEVRNSLQRVLVRKKYAR